MEQQPLPVLEPAYVNVEAPHNFEMPAIGNLGNEIDAGDAMYVTSITSLVMITVLVLSVVMSYTGCKYIFS